MDLEYFYKQMTNILWPMSITGKLTLLIALGLSMRLPFRYREQVITAMFAFQFFVLAYASFFLSSSARVIDDDESNNIFVVIVAAGSLMSAIAMTLAAWKPEGRWNLKADFELNRWVGWLFILIGFLYPFFTKTIITGIIFSPVSIIPHPTILILSGMLIAGFPNVARLPIATAIMGCLMIGGLDMYGGLKTYVPLFGAAIYMSGLLIYSSIKSGGFLEDDRPDIDVKMDEEKKAFFKGKTKEKKTWKLK